MRLKVLIPLCQFWSIVRLASDAQAITGTILIKKKLTKPSVTASVSVYQRGTAVKLGKDAEQDPIAYERSRVVIYLEGPVPAVAKSGRHRQHSRSSRLDRRFMPDMVVVPVGSTVSFPNMDPIFHNIYSLSKPKSSILGATTRERRARSTFPETRHHRDLLPSASEHGGDCLW